MISSVLSARCWLPAVLLALLVGCGPGVEGTGTGDKSYALDFFGARPVSVCTAQFASELNCPQRVVVGPSPLGPNDGSDPVLWVDDPAAAAVTAKIKVSAIEFDAPCEGIRFEGAWGTTAQGESRFFGEYRSGSDGVVYPGSISVVQNTEAGLIYLLRNENGRIVLGPRLLLKTGEEPKPADCQRVFSSPIPVPRAR
jgi:hypothetical protein